MHDPDPAAAAAAAPTLDTVDVLRLAAAHLHALGPSLRSQAAHISPDDLGDDLADQFRQVIDGFAGVTDSFAVEVDQLVQAYDARPLPPSGGAR